MAPKATNVNKSAKKETISAQTAGATINKNQQQPTQSHTNASRLNERALLAKLQEMVPNMHNEKKLTKLKIIRGVTEYIKKLTDVIDSDNNSNNENDQDVILPSNNDVYQHHSINMIQATPNNVNLNNMNVNMNTSMNMNTITTNTTTATTSNNINTNIEHYVIAPNNSDVYATNTNNYFVIATNSDVYNASNHHTNLWMQ